MAKDESNERLALVISGSYAFVYLAFVMLLMGKASDPFFPYWLFWAIIATATGCIVWGFIEKIVERRRRGR